MDIFLIMRMINYGARWKDWDKSFFLFVLSCHSVFYVALLEQDRELLDILHTTVFLSVLFGIGISDPVLLGFLIVFTGLVQIQWIYTNKCILNSDQQNDKPNEDFSRFAAATGLVYSCFLSYRYGSLF